MPIEHIRNIIKFGSGSYVVTLPKAWLRFYKLDERDMVRVVANGKVTIEPIIIKPLRKPKENNEK